MTGLLKAERPVSFQTTGRPLQSRVTMRNKQQVPQKLNGTTMSSVKLLDLVNVIDELVGAVEALDQSEWYGASVRPIGGLCDRVRELASDGSAPINVRAQAADANDAVARLMRRFGSRLRIVIGNGASFPDPGVRPKVSDALRSGKTVDALGALLGISEWAERTARHRDRDPETGEIYDDAPQAGDDI